MWMSDRTGLIIKLTGGLYSVYDFEDHQLYQCRARGKFRLEPKDDTQKHRYKKNLKTQEFQKIDIKPKVGDLVSFQVLEQDKGYLIEVKNRRNDLVRPQISNVDKVLLVFSVKKPDYNSNLLDRMLALISFYDIEPVLIFSKMDLLDNQSKDEISDVIEYYEKIGYKIYQTSFKQYDRDAIMEEIKGHICVIAGQTGVGKSTLLNLIDPNLNLKTDEISLALGRGKHTTRHVELIAINEGWIADTPGFGIADFQEMDESDLSHSFIEFFQHSAECKFSSCIHENEPKCKVKELVETNQIMQSRYENYLLFLNEIREKKRKKY
jgi:ribosome biogenesis GTPase / thiamine phosphate phosphatase